MKKKKRRKRRFLPRAKIENRKKFELVNPLVFDGVFSECELTAPFILRYVCPFERVIRIRKDGTPKKKLYFACIFYDELSDRFRSRANEHLLVMDPKSNEIVERRNYKFFSDAIVHFPDIHKLVFLENSLICTMDTQSLEINDGFFTQYPCGSSLLAKKNNEEVLVHQNGSIKVVNVKYPDRAIRTILERNADHQNPRRRTRLSIDPNCFTKPESHDFLMISNGTKIGIVDLNTNLMRVQVDTARSYIKSLIFIPDDFHPSNINNVGNYESSVHGRLYAGSKNGHIEIFEVHISSLESDDEHQKEEEEIRSIQQIKIDQEKGGDINHMLIYGHKYLFINSKDSHRFNIYDVTRGEEVFGPGFIKEWCFLEYLEKKNSVLFWGVKKDELFSVNTQGKIFLWKNRLYDLQALERGRMEEKERGCEVVQNVELDKGRKKCVTMKVNMRNLKLYSFLLPEFE